MEETIPVRGNREGLKGVQTLNKGLVHLKTLFRVSRVQGI